LRGLGAVEADNLIVSVALLNICDEKEKRETSFWAD